MEISKGQSLPAQSDAGITVAELIEEFIDENCSSTEEVVIMLDQTDPGTGATRYRNKL